MAILGAGKARPRQSDSWDGFKEKARITALFSRLCGNPVFPVTHLILPDSFFFSVLCVPFDFIGKCGRSAAIL